MFRFTIFWEKIIVIIEAFWLAALTIIAEARVLTTDGQT